MEQTKNEPTKENKATRIEVTPTKIIFKDSNGKELYSVDAVEIGVDKLVEKGII